MSTINEYLSGITYPGRGILVGRKRNEAVVAYFIMGRSTNSRNRVFVREREGIRTKAFDESKVTDPSLIIYWPVREYSGRLIVTNGDQTDTVYSFFRAGMSFEEALNTRKYEPDRPNYTPRISAVLNRDGSFSMSILKNAGPGEGECIREYYDYADIEPGKARIIHTYKDDGDPLPPFEGEPVEVEITGGIDEFTRDVWNSLNSDNKVSLFVRFVSLEDGSSETRIVNKHE